MAISGKGNGIATLFLGDGGKEAAASDFLRKDAIGPLL